MTVADSAENTTVQPVQNESWGLILLVMGPQIIVGLELLVGMFLFPIQRVQWGTIDFFCGFGATLDRISQILSQYPRIFLEIPILWFLVAMVVVWLIGDH